MDKVFVANLALSLVGAKAIASLNEDSASCRIINKFYDVIRDEVLSEAIWTFAQKRAALSQLVETPVYTDDQVTVMYSLPNDFIKLNFMSDPSALVKLEGGKLLSNTLGLKIQYTFRNDDPATYYPKFLTAFATRLAAAICFNLTESVQKAKDLLAEYEGSLLPRAVSSDSQQGTPLGVDQTEWDSARFIGGNAFIVPSGAQTWHPVW
jgi:hypothetical protein